MKEDTESQGDQWEKNQPCLLFWNMLSNTETLMFSWREENKKNIVSIQNKFSKMFINFWKSVPLVFTQDYNSGICYNVKPYSIQFIA